MFEEVPHEALGGHLVGDKTTLPHPMTMLAELGRSLMQDEGFLMD